MPPQHGKSYGASVLLPAYLLGINPELRICIASYSFSLARRFGAQVRQIIETDAYQKTFPKTMLKGMPNAPKHSSAQLTTDEFDIVGHSGGLKLVGKEGSLTGTRVDVMILDDMYKDAAEAYSPLQRENLWNWYTSVVKTRLHNNSQELIVFTRWHEDDLIGRLLKTEKTEWNAINFEAIKCSAPSELDPRKKGEVLWSNRHSKKLLLQKKKLDPVAFEALYQGNPTPNEGLLYGKFLEYESLPNTTKRAGYIDTADSGDDYLCAIAYQVDKNDNIYITEVVYSAEPMEITEKLCTQMLEDSNTQICYVESNNGGRGFARVLQRNLPRCRIESFFQSANKVARITSNATEVIRCIYMPKGWERRWSEFSAAVKSIRRNVAASKHDDTADALTGIIEKETLHSRKKTSIAFKNY
ncbi:MAG: phage terminase large subunit [Rikenellaceae bacterium]